MEHAVDMTTPDGLTAYLRTLPTANLREIAARPVFNGDSAAMSLAAATIVTAREG